MYDLILVLRAFYSEVARQQKQNFSNLLSKLLILLYYVWVAISAILWPGCPSAVFIIVLLLI